MLIEPLASSDSSGDALLAALARETEPLTSQRLLAFVGEAFALDGAALIERTPAIQIRAAFGTVPSLPAPLVAEAADRAAVAADARTVVVPLPASETLLAGDADPGSLKTVAQSLAAAADALAVAVWLADAVAARQVASDLLERSAGWVGEDERTLLEQLAQSVCDLLDCDRASVFIHDAARGELVGAPALGVPGGTLRLPEDAGIVGQVLASSQPERVADAHADDRFDASVDAKQNYRTETVLAVPMLRVGVSPRGGSSRGGGPVGVIQAINKRTGPFDRRDQSTLSLLAIQAAAAIERTQERDRLLRRNESLQAQVRSEGVGVGRMVAHGPAMAAIRDTIGRLASTDLPVLVLGESGSGKEVCAQALHESGSRAGQPFVAVNCAALAETLLESELFGHEAGAFTDARQTRPGKFELADGGTLFLDEVGDMSAGGQAKLLRVLEQKVVTRVGGSAAIPVDVRIVAATNAKLTERIREGAFREDLYYRLAVVTIDLPPLRDRPDDILPLAEHFLGGFLKQAGRDGLRFSEQARRRLQAHHWPGNVRELRNLMERVAFLAPGPKIEPGDLPFMTAPGKATADEAIPAGLPLSEATAEFQARYIEAVIERTRSNMTDAASQLGLHRSNLYRKMRQLGMGE